MKYKYQYQSNEERESLISQNDGKTLIEEHNLLAGNFLVFTDDILEIPANQFKIEQLKLIIDIKKNYLYMDCNAEQTELAQLLGY